LLSLVLFACFALSGFSQTRIALADVSKHVGDSVTVEGKIFGVETFTNNPQAPTLLNIGADFPNQALTIAVFSSYQSGSIVMPSESEKGDNAKVTGEIELYKGSPQIVVRIPSQLYLPSSDAVTSANGSSFISFLC
jgi:hypothetical protein